MNKSRELAKSFREIADLYDELANIEENEELDKQKKEEAQEEILGKLMVKMVKLQN